MAIQRIIPWKFILRRLSRSQGFLDPIRILRQFNRFASPAEFVAPTELLRAAAWMHARGLMNSQAIQHNLDWVWPYWVERQFNPRSMSFIPRAFSVSHINLTHRNWTAVGIPGCDHLPIVDPRGMVTPLFDGWSIDAWLVSDDGKELLPSREVFAEQTSDFDDNLRVVTRFQKTPFTLTTTAEVILLADNPVARIVIEAHSTTPARLAVSARPFNPEGVSFIYTIAITRDGAGWTINKRDHAFVQPAPERHLFSRYRDGDVFADVQSGTNAPGGDSVSCDVGMATAAALFSLSPCSTRSVTVEIPLTARETTPEHSRRHFPLRMTWHESLADAVACSIPDKRIRFLFENAIRTIILHSPGDVFAGPYTYKRFWFRDASIIVYAMACAGLVERAKTVIERMPRRQSPSGHFLSQEGEWDSNGQVLWAIDRYCELAGSDPPLEWKRAIRRGADWICRKRHSHKAKPPHAGLLPAGFSAEHLGPNDHYYWDNYWSVAGLYAAADLMTRYDDAARAARYRDEANDLHGAIEAGLREVAKSLGRDILPASPTRRMDSGAVGSIVASYPLQVCAPDDPRLNATLEYLIAHCTLDNGFFHDISHSGINGYLTLHIAQALLRKGDARYIALVKALADLASGTGQWPEAIHPWLGTGCMGDGQHVWAAAEWVLMIRNCFVREERRERSLVLFSGIPREWYKENERIAFGPARTAYGMVSLSASLHGESLDLAWEGTWNGPPPRIELKFPWGHAETPGASASSATVRLERMEP